MIRHRNLMAAALLLAAAAPAQAQSLFAARGLGVPVTPADARVAALGGIGVGLAGFHATLTNPSELGGLTRRGVTAVLQPMTTSVDVDGAEDGTSGTRFPLIAVAYPINSRLITTLGFSGYLDQTWGVTSEGTSVVGDQTVPYTDLLQSTGGMSQLRVNAAYMLTPTLSVGLGGGMLLGNVDRAAARVFNDTTGTLSSFEQRLSWSFSAPVGAVGVRWDAGRNLRLAVSAMAGADVEAKGDTTAAEDRTFGGPLEVAGGASARLSSLLLATAGAVWSRYPGVTADASREVVRVGGGVEYEGIRTGTRTFPLRVGGHWQQLPYHGAGEEPATEWGAGIGVGFRLGDPMNPAAVADFGVERGGRSGFAGGALTDGVSEGLWRFTLSLSLFGT